MIITNTEKFSLSIKTFSTKVGTDKNFYLPNFQAKISVFKNRLLISQLKFASFYYLATLNQAKSNGNETVSNSPCTLADSPRLVK